MTSSGRRRKGETAVASSRKVKVTLPTDEQILITREFDAPKHLVKGEIAYDDNQGPFGRIGVDYMSRRFFTYTNDQSVGARAIVDATIGYRIQSGRFKDWAIQGNVTNLFDKGYISTIGSNGFGNSGDNQTLLAGAPRQVFATLKVGF